MMNFDARRVQFYESEVSGSDLAKFHLREKEVNGFRLTETRLPPNFRIPKHSHANGSFCFVLAGSFTEKCRSLDKNYKSSDMMFSPSDEIHSDEFHHAGGHCFFLEFSPLSLERAREYSLRLDAPMEFQGGIPALIATRLYQEFRRMDDSSPLAIEGLAFEIMAEISRRQVKSEMRNAPRWLMQAKDLLHARFAERLSLAEIAAVINIHPIHLARVFRQFNDCSLGEYARRLRIQDVSHQLLNSEKSLAEIALTAGFSDQAHFSRTFKKQTGLTPAEFRNTFSRR